MRKARFKYDVSGVLPSAIKIVYSELWVIIVSLIIIVHYYFRRGAWTENYVHDVGKHFVSLPKTILC